MADENKDQQKGATFTFAHVAELLMRMRGMIKDGDVPDEVIKNDTAAALQVVIAAGGVALCSEVLQMMGAYNLQDIPLENIENQDQLEQVTLAIAGGLSVANAKETVINTGAAAAELLQTVLNFEDIRPYLNDILKEPGYRDKTAADLIDATDQNGQPLFLAAIREAAATAERIKAQNAGREERRRAKERAIKQGAIMGLKGGKMSIFSARNLWQAFAPERISKIGTLSPDMIDKRTGRIETGIKTLPLEATDISLKVLWLLNTILANTVDNVRDTFIQDGTINFYVKGVLDSLDIDPRIRNDMQLNLDRKTAGVLHLEKQLEPFLSFVGTTEDGSRYSILNYDGYDVNTDTMTIRTPYLFQLWHATQQDYSKRKAKKELFLEEGKKIPKKELKPLEINELFKATAYKEDDVVLEIAAYITNILLNAGKSSKKTEIRYETLIDNCPRLKQRIDDIEKIPNTQRTEKGKKINKPARINTELRKISKAISLIMDTQKCDARNYFDFEEITPSRETENGELEFISPTKSLLDGKITIKWHRINDQL